MPQDDVETACTNYMRTVVSLVYDCYIRFGPHIDAHQRYTAEYFEKIGQTIEDAEEEAGFPRGWTDSGDPASLPYRWQMLRDSVTGCEINHIYQKYLQKAAPAPDRLPNLSGGTTGWAFLPEEWRRTGDPEEDVRLYLQSLREGRSP